MKTQTTIFAPPHNPVPKYCVELLRLLDASGIKKKSSKAKTLERGFIHGIRAVLGEDTPPYLLVCLHSGRSILD